MYAVRMFEILLELDDTLSANQNAVCSVCWRIELQRFYGVFLIVRSSLLALGKQNNNNNNIK